MTLDAGDAVLPASAARSSPPPPGR